MANGRPAVMRWAIPGSIFFGLSKGFEAMGDAAPYAADGVSGERLVWHLTALVLFIFAGVCGFLFFRGLFKRYVVPPRDGDRQHPTPMSDARVFADAETFDPDAALARYMAKRSAPEQTIAPRPGGFGRKSV